MISKDRDINCLEEIISQGYEHQILRDYGDDGITDFKDVLENIRSIYKHINLRNYSSIVIFKSDSINLNVIHTQTYVINDFSHLTQFESSLNLTIQVKKVDELIVSLSEVDISLITPTNFAYQYTSDKERFYTKMAIYDLPSIPDADSYFAIPTFKSLDIALSHYKINFVRTAFCPYIQEALCPQKIFFKPKPEKHLRRSLEFFLKARMREYTEIRPEQIVDESHPVDLKITWQGINHIAIIEIKWLGKSLATDGGNSRFSSTHDESRALSGARQLVEYLDSNKERTANFNTIGYLVIYDLRRKDSVVNMIKIDRDNGLFYENQEVDFNPRYHEIRKDFAKPIRMFIYPSM